MIAKHGSILYKHKISLQWLPNTQLCPFEGAPGDTPAEASLLYLGDIEISEDATLADLKCQVSHPAAARLRADANTPCSEILICSSISFSLNYSLF